MSTWINASLILTGAGVILAALLQARKFTPNMTPTESRDTWALFLKLMTLSLIGYCFALGMVLLGWLDYLAAETSVVFAVGAVLLLFSVHLATRISKALLRFINSLQDEIKTRTLQLAERTTQLECANNELENEVRVRKRAEEALASSYHELQRTMVSTIYAMARTVETRDPYTAGHQMRVAELCKAIAVHMKLSNEQILAVHMAAMVHDIGKINVPAEILSKPGGLTEIEVDLVRIHPQVSYEILKEIDFPWPIAEIVLQHHERLDGSGYPSGVTDEEMLPEARILAVADVVEAMSSDRPYRAAPGLERALKEISRGKGVLYDKAVVDACAEVINSGIADIDWTNENAEEESLTKLLNVEPKPVR
jgi:putative nucleotidyltransferase with HDIG domain